MLRKAQHAYTDSTRQHAGLRFHDVLRHAVVLLAVSASAVSVASGQTETGGRDRVAAESNSIQHFTFQTLLLSSPDIRKGESGANRIHLPEFYFQKDREFQRLSVANQELGRPQRFSGPRPFRLFKRFKNPEGEADYRPVAELSDGPEAERPGHQILLLGRTEDGFKLSAIAADPETLGTTDMLVLNASPHQVAARAARGGTSSPVLVEPGSSSIVRYETGDSGKFRLEMAAKRSDEWKIIHNARIPQGQNEPLFLLVHPNQRRSDHWNVRFLRLHRPGPPAPE